MKRKGSSDTMSTLKKNVEHLYKAVYHGNGSPAIVTQITKLNENLNNLEEKVENKFESLETEMSLKFKNITDVVTEKFNHLSEQINYEFTHEKNVLDKKWSHKTAIFTGVLASITSLTVVIVSEILKKIHF
jgi:predicted nuclease with TOPRIM domain